MSKIISEGDIDALKEANINVAESTSKVSQLAALQTQEIAKQMQLITSMIDVQKRLAETIVTLSQRVDELEKKSISCDTM